LTKVKNLLWIKICEIAGNFLVLACVLSIRPEGAIVDIVRMIFAFLVGTVLIS